MTLAVFFHNIGDILEGLEKKLGLADDQTKAIRADGVAVLTAFATKWGTDTGLALLSLGKGFVQAVIADPSTLVAQAELLFTEAVKQELQITLDDAKDALRTILISTPSVVPVS